MDRLREVIAIGALLGALWTPSASAETLSFSFVDRANDAWGCSSSGCGIPFPSIVGPATDVVGLSFGFDNVTGTYVATMSASAARPFTGDVVVNVNLFDVNTQTLFTSSNHRFVGTPVTVLSVTGTSTQLLTWQAGDRVAACQGPGGIIPETCLGGLGSPLDFSSGVINFSPYPSTQTARDSFQSTPPATIGTPAPPATGMITSSEFPSFRFWVRISGSRTGTSVTDCLPETVCVAGSIPTRAEVFVRIVGPKPNGYLWPSIVKFNTTRTEVWIEQVTTGVIKYYNFPALPSDASELPGYVDKTGFLP
ncbi:MAG TPA: hypothetical protein VEW48_18505 [Thermoanaerobaculia bacterium]|nr:hypothetical protein [Thermoanaerobaculia bacterium]